MGEPLRQADATAAASQPPRATRRWIDGEVLVHQALSGWGRVNQVLLTAASVGALAASVLIGISSCTQQENHRNAVVDADRQEAAFRAISLVHAFYDAGQRNLAAVHQFRLNKGTSHEFTLTAGQRFDDSFQAASSGLLTASLKSIGYESHDRLLHMRDVAGEAHAAVAYFYNSATVGTSIGGQDLASDETYNSAMDTAARALTSVSFALQNAQNAVSCDFAYSNGEGGQALSQCPFKLVNEPSIELPPGSSAVR